MNNDLIRGTYYHCGGKIFRNKLQALSESMVTGHYPRFYYADEVFGSKDWTVPVADSIQTLIARRAMQLREKYDYLILSWSGGTDSHTMYQGFVKNKIYIDEIVVAYASQGDDLTLRANPTYAVSWLRKNHPNLTTKITEIDRCDPIHQTYYDNEYWVVEKWSNNLSRFEGTIEKPSFYADALARAKGKSYAIVQGLEKPCVRLENNKWYAYFLDCSNYADVMCRTDTEPFFATPDLAEMQIKQAQLLRHNTEIRLAVKQIDTAFWDSRQDLGSKDPLYTYAEHATACGLDNELVEHASIAGKLSTRQYWGSLAFDKIKDNAVTKTIRNRHLTESLAGNQVHARNYVKGLNSVFTDKKFADWLIDNCWMSKDATLVQLRGMMSDLFYLGDRTGA